MTNMLCFVIKTAQQLPFHGPLICCQNCKSRELSNNDIYKLSCHMNLSRRITCPMCDKANEEATISAWQQLQGNDELVVVKEIQLYPNEFERDSVIDQLIDTDVNYSQVCGLPTAMAQLQMELRGKSVPFFLQKAKVPISEAIQLGLTFNMIVGTKTNWEIMLVHKLYTAEDLVALGATFTRLLCAGMPLDIFIDCGMDIGALHMIQFNRHAFDAAGGTEEKWQQVLKVAMRGLKPENFSLHFGNEYVCSTCRPKS